MLMDKVDNMREQMNSVSKEMKILRKHQKGNAIDWKHWNKWRMPLMGSLVPWMWLKKEYVSLRIPQILIEIFKIKK